MNELLQYVKKLHKGHLDRVGVLLAVKMGDNVYIAWSKCKLTGQKADKFNPKRGREICEGRLRGKLGDGDATRQMPHSFRSAMNKFAKRCAKYFKVKEDSLVLV